MKRFLSMLLTVILAAAVLPSSVLADSAEDAAAFSAAAEAADLQKDETDVSDTAGASNALEMYRMYNPNSGEHFYTSNAGERNNLVSCGWRYEGIGWVAPASGDPVYRLYNPNAGDHHYTTSKAERDNLVGVGWRLEGVGWYAGGSVPIYRQYNPNAVAGAHNFTTSKAENDNLVKVGWKGEGVAFTCVGEGYAADRDINYYDVYHDTLVQFLNDKVSEYSKSWWTIPKNQLINDSRYTLFDITGDGIKELIISFVPYQSGSMLYFYTYDGKKTKQFESFNTRHEELRPAGNDIVYEYLSNGIVSIDKIRWDGQKLVRERIASGKGAEIPADWSDSIFRSLHAGAPLTMCRITDFSLLRK